MSGSGATWANGDVACGNGVTQAEVVKVITHLAFYAGWPSAVTAIAVTKDVVRKQ